MLQCSWWGERADRFEPDPGILNYLILRTAAATSAFVGLFAFVSLTHTSPASTLCTSISIASAAASGFCFCKIKDIVSEGSDLLLGLARMLMVRPRSKSD